MILYARNIKRLSLIAFLLMINISLVAQDYWQQKVNYEIYVNLNDVDHSLSGDIKIQYHNQSPDSLTYIYIHLWPNAYKNENTALCEQMLQNGNSDLYYADSSKLGYINLIDFSSNNIKLNWEYDEKHIDIAKVYLGKTLLPGEQIEISTPFFIKIPSSEFSRLGHSKQSYQITQWYPKPAVYDSEGWHQMPYLNQGEFYSEFGSFDVYITLPANYRVGATGDLINGQREEQWMDSLAKVTAAISKFPKDTGFPASFNETKTLHFHQEKVHDFAWFADKRYHVLRGNITLSNGKIVETQALFTNEEARLWKKSLKYIGRSTQYYSTKVGNYPYKRVTAVQGTLSAGAGMEYPNITIIGESNTSFALEETIMHEVGHNWFYGIFGFNERDFPWLDEGLNTFYQTQYTKEYYPDLTLMKAYLDVVIPAFHLDELDDQYAYYLGNKFLASYNLDQSANLKSQDFTSMNYGVIAYTKMALSFQNLQAYLGKEKFQKIMMEFYTEWSFKHPQPDDLIKFFEEKSQEDLSWFFQGYINSKGRNDYKICSVKKNGDSLNITLKNKGDINAPILISGTGLLNTDLESQWYPGFSDKKTITFPTKNYKKITVNQPYNILDYNPGNNFYYPNKLFSKKKKLKVKFLTSMPWAEESHIYFTPVMGWNAYNKFMLGALIYNHSAFEKKWEYELMPLYSFNTNNWNGFFGLHRNIYFNSKIRRLSIGVVGKKYNYNSSTYDNEYRKLSPEVIFYFKNPKGKTRIKHMARLRSVYIEKEIVDYELNLSGQYIAFQNTKYYNVFELNYTYNNKRIINPFGIEFNTQFNSDIVKADITAHYTLSYQKPKRGLDIRLFAGNIFSYNTSIHTNYSYKLSSWDGGDDYLNDYTYFGRSEVNGFYGAQMQMRDGGFFLPSALGRSWGFIGALNLRTTLPFTQLIQLYGNIGTTINPKALQYQDKEPVLYEAGIILSIINKSFEVYFPVVWSEEYQDVMDLNPDYNYTNNIRFTMRLDLLDPFKALKELNL